VRNTVTGLRQLPPAEFECAQGMGMTPSQALFLVELPEALPIIAQGARVALVINVGVAPLAFLVGGGGLGDLIFSGIDLFQPAMMLAGAIPQPRWPSSSIFSVASHHGAGFSGHPERRRDRRATVVLSEETKCPSIGRPFATVSPSSRSRSAASRRRPPRRKSWSAARLTEQL
jgi:hypothetical protein